MFLKNLVTKISLKDFFEKKNKFFYRNKKGINSQVARYLYVHYEKQEING